VHFAGEHTEFREMGMEAAVASGQRAAVEML
jgi:monoamine oxidase